MRKPTKLEAERTAARERQRIEQENGARLAELRMAEEIDDYRLPAKRPPVAGNTAPETERQRLERQAWREEQEAAEAAERERREAPIRAAQAQLQETQRRIAQVQRDTLTNPKIEDQDFWIDPAVAGASMPLSQAREQNLNEWIQFHQRHPEFFPSERNIQLLSDYQERNHAEIYSEEMLSRSYQKFLDAGVEFDKRPAPEPESDLMQYDKRPQANLSAAPPSKPTPVLYDGWDEDGNPCQYTDRQVSRWSSEEMRRRLRLYPDKLTLPAIGPGPLGTGRQT